MNNCPQSYKGQKALLLSSRSEGAFLLGADDAI